MKLLVIDDSLRVFDAIKSALAKAKKTGINDYIEKPFISKDLKKKSGIFMGVLI